MRGSKAKKLRRLVFGSGYHWPTVKTNAGMRRQYRKAKKAGGSHQVLRRRAAVNATKAKMKIDGVGSTR